MANSLLDFVMALVRDPDAAARYAADPGAALASAGLPDVTTADVDQLIPVVTDSMSGTLPVADANVWASGAATAAFDAFGIDDSIPVVAHDLDDLAVREVVDTVDLPGVTTLPVDEPPAIEVPDLDDLPVHEPLPDVAVLGVTEEDLHAPDPSGFDLFD